MTIRSDSFSSVSEVLGFTRWFLDGQSAFNAGTRPTLTEVEKFIDRASALLNVAIDANSTLSASDITHTDVYNNAVTKLACDDWVTQQAVKYVHYTSRNTAIFSDQNETFKMDSAAEFVEMMALGFSRDISGESELSNGLQFTAMDIQSNRADPVDSSKEQPKFTRGLFDNNS